MIIKLFCSATITNQRILLKEQLHKLKNEIEEYLDFFSSEDLILVTSILKILKMMVETDASNETIQKYFTRLKYPIQIIEEKIKRFKKLRTT